MASTNGVARAVAAAGADRDKFVAVAKALHVELKEMVGQSEAQILVRTGKMLEGELRKMLESELGERLKGLESKVKGMEEAFDKRLTELGKSYADGISGLAGLLKAMPAPVVNVAAPNVHVPAGAIEVKQLPSQVHVDVAAPSVHIPEKSLHVEVKQLPSQVHVDVSPNIHLPEKALQVNMLPSVVNVSPHLKMLDKSIEVKVQAPPPRKRKTTKSIIYDQQSGRPSRVEEEESEV